MRKGTKEQASNIINLCAGLLSACCMCEVGTLGNLHVKTNVSVLIVICLPLTWSFSFLYRWGRRKTWMLFCHDVSRSSISCITYDKKKIHTIWLVYKTLSWDAHAWLSNCTCATMHGYIRMKKFFCSFVFFMHCWIMKRQRDDAMNIDIITSKGSVETMPYIK